MSEQKCKWESKYPDYTCGERAMELDPHGYCILHSRREDKGTSRFTEKIEERINTKGDKADLRGCYFPSDFDSEYFKERTFDKPIDFSEVIFSQHVRFLSAKFLQEVNFVRATFIQSVSFSHVKFSQKVYFDRAIFSQEVSFLGTCFDKGVYFSWAEFRGRVLFRPVTVSIGDIKGPVVREKEVTLGYPTLFRYTKFIGEVIFQEVDLSHCSFLYSNIDKVYFWSCKFGEKEERLLGIIPHRRRNVLRDELDSDEGAKGNPKGAKEEYEHVRRLYLELKRNFEDKKDWNTAGDFHYGEMECRRKMKGWFSLEGFYFLASGYGERSLRAFIVLFVLICLFFPVMYVIFERDPFWVSVWDSFRVATFMRIGTPIEPDTGLGKFFLALESILCPTQFALFALALRRKVKR